MTSSNGVGKDYWDRVAEKLSGPTGSKESCDYYPCHHHGQDCAL